MENLRVEEDISFDDWMHNVDLLIAYVAFGLTSADLPDYLYRDAYNSKAGAGETARDALEAAGYPL